MIYPNLQPFARKSNIRLDKIPQPKLSEYTELVVREVLEHVDEDTRQQLNRLYDLDPS